MCFHGGNKVADELPSDVTCAVGCEFSVTESTIYVT